MRVPIVTTLGIEEFSGGKATIKNSGTINAIYGKRADGTPFATQRPGINIFEDASAALITDAAGRGVYYWDAADAKYHVNGDTVYKGGYAGPLAQTITAGIERVEFFEVGDYLVIIDVENNEGWYIAIGATTTLIAMTGGGMADFPPNQTPTLQLAKGGAVLNGTLYVGCTNGEIWNSGVEDPLNWGSADFINAEVSPDSGVLIYSHLDHICAIGTRSTEFFYDAANATGSPLNVRTDVSHALGAADFNSAWAEYNSLYFVGQTPSGSLSVYLISNFSVNKVSDDDFDSMLTTALITDGAKCMGSGLTSGGRSFYCLTIYYDVSGVIAPDATYVFEDNGIVGEWELMHTGIDDFPIIDWTKATTTRAGEGILSNGDLITVLDDFSPTDTTESSGYIEDWIATGYFSESGSSGESISMEAIVGQGDSGTLETKFADRLRAVCTPTENNQNLLVQWSDEGNNNYNTGRNIDLSNPKNKLNRCGSYKLRNYKLTYSGSEKIELEGIEVQVRV